MYTIFRTDVNISSDSNGDQQSAQKVAELERVQRVLRTQLQSATADLIRMTSERDCLMEISNSLHADFNRSFHAFYLS
jgi:hypothetical protein